MAQATTPPPFPTHNIYPFIHPHDGPGQYPCRNTKLPLSLPTFLWSQALAARALHVMAQASPANQELLAEAGAIQHLTALLSQAASAPKAPAAQLDGRPLTTSAKAAAAASRPPLLQCFIERLRIATPAVKLKLSWYEAGFRAEHEAGCDRPK